MQDGDNVALFVDGVFDLFAKPVFGVFEAVEAFKGEDGEEVSAGGNLAQNDALKFASVDVFYVHEGFVACVFDGVEDGTGDPAACGAAVADEDGFSCFGWGMCFPLFTPVEIPIC